MIKRIRFATKHRDLAPESFAPAWRRAVAAGADAPEDIRPSRIAVCTALPEVIANPKHDGIGLEWFADRAHEERYEAWLRSEPAAAVSQLLDEAVELDASPVVLADELVLRGHDWLDRRWSDGGMRLKHMAIARRAAGLSLREFSERWRGRSGTLNRPGNAEVLVIPDEARGLAYVQNHALARPSGDWPYDALNEVYFDDLDSLRARIAWFDENLSQQTEDDLVRESWFVAASEEMLFDQR